MNREILFKAKRKDNGEWVEGYLFDDGMPKPKRYFIGGIIIKPYEGTACDKWNVVGIDFCEIDPDTLCQYTGLTDKNGKKIWENDIVVDEDGCYYEVFWNKNLCNYSLRCFKTKHMFLIGKRWDLYLLANNNRLKVVGNIFDNPELLEV